MSRDEQIADALQYADWSGASIGNKALVQAAINALRTSPAIEPDEGWSASELMQDFYCSRYYEPKAERPADNVRAAIEFAIDRVTPSLRTQLTAATQRAEQAERMLADIREALRKNVSISDAHDLESGDIIGEQVNVLFPSGTEAQIETLWPVLTSIRSAASGEQGA